MRAARCNQVNPLGLWHFESIIPHCDIDLIGIARFDGLFSFALRFIRETNA